MLKFSIAALPAPHPQENLSMQPSTHLKVLDTPTTPNTTPQASTFESSLASVINLAASQPSTIHPSLLPSSDASPTLQPALMTADEDQLMTESTTDLLDESNTPLSQYTTGIADSLMASINDDGAPGDHRRDPQEANDILRAVRPELPDESNSSFSQHNTRVVDSVMASPNDDSASRAVNVPSLENPIDGDGDDMEEATGVGRIQAYKKDCDTADKVGALGSGSDEEDRASGSGSDEEDAASGSDGDEEDGALGSDNNKELGSDGSDNEDVRPKVKRRTKKVPVMPQVRPKPQVRPTKALPPKREPVERPLKRRRMSVEFEGDSPSNPIDVDLYASIWEPTTVKELVSIQMFLR